MLKTLAQILACEGYFTVVGTATDGCQAFKKALALSSELVLVGFDLPYLNGSQVTEYIKHFRNPPVVFIVTSKDASGCRATSEVAGADAFIVKSGNLKAQLRARLQERFGPTAKPIRQSGRPK